MQTPDRRLIPVLCMGPNHPPPKSIFSNLPRLYNSPYRKHGNTVYFLPQNNGFIVELARLQIILHRRPTTCIYMQLPSPFFAFRSCLRRKHRCPINKSRRGNQQGRPRNLLPHIKGSEWQEPVKDKRGKLLSSEQEMEECQTTHFMETLIEQATSNS